MLGARVGSDAEVVGVSAEVAVDVVRIPVEVTAPAVVFDVVARGYDRRQVHAHVADLEQQLAELRFDAEDVVAQRRLLAEGRAALAIEQQAWRPSYTELGQRAGRILQLAQEEADALRAAATDEARAVRAQAQADALAERAEAQREAEQVRQQAARAAALAEQALAERRELAERELDHARRDAELQVAGALARARASAAEMVAHARREVDELRRAAQQELAQTQSARGRLGAEVVELADRLARVADHLREA